MSLTTMELFSLRLATNSFGATALVFGVYYRLYRRADLAFSCVVINLVTFLLCFVTHRSTLDLGFALGLFAVFGILRYRTESVPVRDLTYLFAAIGVAIVNGLPAESIPTAVWLVANGALVLVPLLLEQTPWAGQEHRALRLDEIALLAPGCGEQLRETLRRRTGLDVTAVQVERMDLLRETADLTVYFRRGSPRPKAPD